VNVRSILVGATLTAGLVSALAGVALARNPHCAGGIQYVVQGMNDKQKGNTDDYKREMSKAVQQLEQCLSEDPQDFEAQGYLGWAYAEVDSPAAAGRAFAAAVKGLQSKGDKKAAQWEGNWTSYWVQPFNDGIQKINDAQKLDPDFCKGNGANHAAAEKKYEEAIAAFTKARAYKPDDAKTIRNLGSAYAFMCKYQDAARIFDEGLKAAPGDSGLMASQKAMRSNLVNTLVDEKKYDEAIASYQGLLKQETSNPDLYAGLADTYFRRAATLKDDAQKADFRAAAENYEKAAQLKPTDADLIFNASLSRQNAGDLEKAVENWRATLKLRPNDPQAESALGSALSDLKRYDEAIKILYDAVKQNAKDKNLHRQLAAAYTKADMNPKATEHLMVFLALDKGQAVADAAARTKAAAAGSGAAKTLASDGTPEELYAWEAESQKYETWFYWKKGVAYTFNGGSIVTKSDWSAATPPPPPGAAKKK